MSRQINACLTLVLANILAGIGTGAAPENPAPPFEAVVGFANDTNPIDLVPRLTPRPETVVGVANPRLDLNGVWRFNPDPAPNFWKNNDESAWSNIQVPGQWAMQGFKTKPRAAAGYRLRIAVPADWAGRRVKLRFDAVYSKADVWMNGKAVGSHLGAFTPFEIDVTEAIMPGKENILAVAVASDSLADALTAGLEMVGYPMGGIMRKVSMFVVPNVNVSSFHVTTTFDREYRNAVLHVLVDVANEGPKAIGPTTINLACREYGNGGEVVTLDPAIHALQETLPGHVLPHVIEIPVKSPKKWDAEHPNLYMLTCEVQSGDQHYTIHRRFGFRQTEIREGRFLLNGQPIRLRGMSRQDSHPLMGRTVPLDVHKQDIKWLTWANCNNTYTCAFLPDEDVLSLCDEAGLYVMEEPGTCWVPGRSGFKTDDPKLFPYYLQPVREMIERDRSHPCVITWMICDESAFGRNLLDVLKVTRATDPSRQVHMAYDDPLTSPFDLGSWHFPGPSQFAKAAASKRPVLFDQSVAGHFCVRELMTDPGLRDYWGEQYQAFWEKVWATPSIFGAQAFNLNDDQYIIPGSAVAGNGDWGFLDPWRRAKPEMWHIKKTHTPIKIHDGPIALPSAGRPLEVSIENRYDFSNLSEVRIEWSLGTESGVVQADVAPHRKGTIRIQPDEANLNGKTLALRFLRKGQMVDAYKLPIGKLAKPTVPAPRKPSAPAELVETEQTITARCDGFEWVINRQIGQIIKAGPAGAAVLVGGPVLTILPTKDYPMTPGFVGPCTISTYVPRPATFSPDNTTCVGWKAESVSATRSADGVEITVNGQYHEAAGGYTLRIFGGGDAELTYRFTYNAPEKIRARQIGMVWFASRSLDLLKWKRQAQWSVYPDDHIGRPEGEARAMPDPSLVAKDGKWMEVAYHDQPSWPWLADANELGTRDFRATRRNIWYASLQDRGDNMVRVLSDGQHHHIRAYLDGDRIGLLVASYSGAPCNADWTHGLNQIVGTEPMIVQKGMEFKDSLRLSLAPQR